MLRKFWTIAAVVMMLGASVASADTFFTQVGEINAAGGQVAGFKSWSATAGSSFVNVNGALANGQTFTAVGETILLASNQANGGTGFPSAGANTQYVAVFALQGVVANANPSNLVGVPTSGVAAVYAVSNAVVGAAGFQTDPSAWTNGTLVAAWSLAPAADVTQGNILAEATPFLASQINTFSVNLIAPQQVQGRLLLNETNGGTSAGNLINATTFDPFGAGNKVLPEQLLTTFAENVATSGNLVTNLNTAGADALVLALLGVGPNAFTAGGYTPATAGTGTPSGDFASNLTNILLVPGVQFRPQEVPEPASMLIWGSLMAAGAFAYRRKRMA